MRGGAARRRLGASRLVPNPLSLLKPPQLGREACHSSQLFCAGVSENLNVDQPLARFSYLFGANLVETWNVLVDDGRGPQQPGQVLPHSCVTSSRSSDPSSSKTVR